MAKILGMNALVYIGGTIAPQRNTWSLTVDRELQEARVFQGASAAETWADNIGGIKSWSGTLDGYYDDTDETMVVVGVATDSALEVVLYEDRGTLTRYWYGDGWFNISENVNVDGVVELSGDFTGTGPLTRIAA